MSLAKEAQAEEQPDAKERHHDDNLVRDAMSLPRDVTPRRHNGAEGSAQLFHQMPLEQWTALSDSMCDC